MIHTENNSPKCVQLRLEFQLSDAEQTIELGAGYTELGATTDDGSPVTIDATAFVDAVGSYPILYDSTDTAGNIATQVSRTVNVVAVIPSVPITFDTSNDNVCSSDPCVMQITVAPGSDRMIVVASTVEGHLNLIDSIDVNGGAGQGILVGTQQVGTGIFLLNVEMWRIMDADILEGVNTVTINFGGIPSDVGVSLMSFSGVAQQPEEVEVSNIALSDSSISTAITTITDGSLIVSAVGHGASGVTYASHGAGQTERHNFTIPSAWHAVTTEIKLLAGSDVQSHTLPSPVIRQAQYVASFAPAN